MPRLVPELGFCNVRDDDGLVSSFPVLGLEEIFDSFAKDGALGIIINEPGAGFLLENIE